MQTQHTPEISLEDIIATPELQTRGVRGENFCSEIRAMRSLARASRAGTQDIFERLTDVALELCAAGSAGISLLETTPDGEVIFRWVVLAGELSPYVGGSTPRSFSPCGVCIDRKTPQLFKRPARFFTYFQTATPEIIEGLVIEIADNERSFGTIWIVSHDVERAFDREDVRIMVSLSNFAAIVLRRDLLDSQADEPQASTALSSWKEIAHFFGKSVRTVQRWERQYGLPVHSPSRRTGAILAFPKELSDWARSLSLRTIVMSRSANKV